MEIALSLGTNLGDRLAHLREAALRISNLPKTTIVAKSRIYETVPVGVKPQYQDMAYLNSVVIIDTEIPVEAISNHIHAIESAMGRIRTEDRFAPRPIDIDILYADNQTRDETALTLPHPRWAQRRFVLQPLADVRPNRILPGYAQCVSELLAHLGGENDVLPLDAEW